VIDSLPEDLIFSMPIMDIKKDGMLCVPFTKDIHCGLPQSRHAWSKANDDKAMWDEIYKQEKVMYYNVCM